MKKIPKFIFLLIIFIAFIQLTLAQEAKTTISFTILDENNNFLADLVSSDIQISHNKKFSTIDSIKQNINQNLEIVIMVDLSTSQDLALCKGCKGCKGCVRAHAGAWGT